VLNEWEPFLWREGETYPANGNELHQLFANGEVDFTITQAPAGAGPAIASGLIPDTARAFSFDEYQIGDYDYVAIPANASNVAAALVTANPILRPDRQADCILPDSGFGLGYAVDLERVSAADRTFLEESLAKLGEPAADPERLARSFAPRRCAVRAATKPAEPAPITAMSYCTTSSSQSRNPRPSQAVHTAPQPVGALL
jgi:putative spermidine/putrescine transport system substrate-binding protein